MVKISFVENSTAESDLHVSLVSTEGKFAVATNK